MNNVDADTIKRQTEMMSQMSDEDLQRKLNQAKSFMPGMFSSSID